MTTPNGLYNIALQGTATGIPALPSAHLILPPPLSSKRVEPDSTGGSLHQTYRREHPLLRTGRLARRGKALLCLCLTLTGLLLTGCEKELTRYEEMVQYHQESLSLPSVAVDSVSRFSQKVTSFVGQHPAAAKDPLYPVIQQNIRQALLRTTITIDDEWDGEIHRDF